MSSAEWEAAFPAVDAGSPAAAPYPTWGESPGFWLCTSGSTGQPKLAMHRHADLVAPARGYAREVLDITERDVFWSVGPAFHAYGLGNSIAFPFSVGATTVLVPTRPPTPGLVAEVMAATRPTLFFTVPTFTTALCAADLPADTFASVRLGVSAAEPLPADVYQRFLDRFGVAILDGIGSTELTHIYCSNRPGPGGTRPGTSGTPVGGYALRLVDDAGAAVADGVAGHLLVAGDTLATGYWCRTEQTRRAFEGAYLRTGDMYERSPDGFYTYLGRSDDMLKVGGEWVSPAEVEAVLIEHPAVLEAAVVGERDAGGVLRPIAFVVVLDRGGRGGRAGASGGPRRAPRRPLPRPPRRLQATEGLPGGGEPAEDGHRQDPALQAARRELSRTDRSLSVEPCVIVISGLPGAGKSTTARLVAARLERAAHIEADRLQEMIVAGGVEPDGSRRPGAEAEAQLDLRLRNACLLARSFVSAGFTAIVDDIVVGDRLGLLRRELAGLPIRLVMLAPAFEHLRRRWLAAGSPFADRWGWIDEELRRTERIGLWLDTTVLTAEQAADEVLARLDEATVDDWHLNDRA